MPFFTALSVAAFSLSSEKVRGSDIPPPSLRWLILVKISRMVFYSLSRDGKAPVINVKTRMKSETQALSGGPQITQ